MPSAPPSPTTERPRWGYRCATVPTPWGTLQFECDADGALLALYRLPANAPFAPYAAAAGDPVAEALRDYCQGRPGPLMGLPYRLAEGTAFQRAVWRLLEEVPLGETRSYAWMAERLGKPGGARAVGQALAKNPLLLRLPCHRVVQSGGAVGGFFGCTEADSVGMKRELLQLERQACQPDRSAATVG